LKRVFTITSFLFLSAFAYAQKDSALNLQLQQKYTGFITDFTTDNLGNIYILTATNQLKKITEKGDSLAVYNDVRRYGKIFSIDASNPLKVLVYYKDYATIVVLDRLLNVRNTIDLRKQNILQVTAVTPSYDNNIWLFDELDNKIKKIDNNGRVLLESVDFRQITDVAPAPESMFDKDGDLYLYDRNKGVLVFDYYTAQKHRHPLMSITDVQVIDKKTITGRDSAHILLYKPATLQLFSFNYFGNAGDYKKIHFSENKIFALNNNGELQLYLVK
jgi:hypothetical protein